MLLGKRTGENEDIKASYKEMNKTNLSLADTEDLTISYNAIGSHCFKVCKINMW